MQSGLLLFNFIHPTTKNKLFNQDFRDRIEASASLIKEIKQTSVHLIEIEDCLVYCIPLLSDAEIQVIENTSEMIQYMIFQLGSTAVYHIKTLADLVVGLFCESREQVVAEGSKILLKFLML